MDLSSTSAGITYESVCTNPYAQTLAKVMISHVKIFGVKKAQSSKVDSYLEVNA